MRGAQNAAIYTWLVTPTSSKYPMAFTDLWRCKGCHTLPDIQVRGKNFLIECACCKNRRVFANSLDEVVAAWNHKNNPLKKQNRMAELIADMREWPQRIKDFVVSEFTRRSFRPTPLADGEAEHDAPVSTEENASAPASRAIASE
jgi:hypothetical protein